jgi:hypothetical protein
MPESYKQRMGNKMKKGLKQKKEARKKSQKRKPIVTFEDVVKNYDLYLRQIV